VNLPRFVPSLLAALGTVLFLPACAPKLYTLNLSRPCQVGWKFSLASSINERSQSHTNLTFPGVTAPQSDDRDQEFTAQLAGDGEVLGIFPNGGIQKLSVTVKSLTATRAGKPVANLPGPGAKITAAREGDKISLSVDGQPADVAVTDVLNELILLDDAKATVQDLFGPKTPVKVGATWTVDSAAIQDALQSGLGGKSSGAKGQMKLESVQGFGAGESATLAGNFSIEQYAPDLPSAMKLDAAQIKGAMVWTVPVTAVHGDIKFTRNMTMTMTAHGNPNDIAVKLAVTGEQKRSLEMNFH
jgi:hypothetical protein